MQPWGQQAVLMWLLSEPCSPGHQAERNHSQRPGSCHHTTYFLIVWTGRSYYWQNLELSLTILRAYEETCIRAFCGAVLAVFEEGGNGSGRIGFESSGLWSPWVTGARVLKLSTGLPWLFGLVWFSLCSSLRRGSTQRGQRHRGLLRKVVRGPGRSGQALRGPEGNEG